MLGVHQITLLQHVLLLSSYNNVLISTAIVSCVFMCVLRVNM
uniref:Uncharacterized protein n=1 Tax=Anguilla anguilla TaxID=7936 RepID=A0A0E9UFF2_ANGAN